jgi:hypothetical protein
VALDFLSVMGAPGDGRVQRVDQILDAEHFDQMVFVFLLEIHGGLLTVR